MSELTTAQQSRLDPKNDYKWESVPCQPEMGSSLLCFAIVRYDVTHFELGQQ